MNPSRILLFVIAGLVALWLARSNPDALSNPDNIVKMVGLVGFLALFLFMGRRRAQPLPGGGGGSFYALIWLGAFAGLAFGYHLWTENRAARDAAQFAAISGGATEGVNQLELRRQRDGHFHVEALVNGVPLHMMVDTGATVTTIPYEQAEALGISTNRLAYIITVRTANGETKAAPAILKDLAMGPIVMKDLRVSVAQPGVLGDPLLGQNVLNRLQGYVVHGDRMILTGR